MNPNNQWSELFVNELAACGLSAVCISPGSRSTPLTLAFYNHPHIQVYLHLDERCAAFFALGMALATEKPVALVCTSGTAAAEFYGAIIEARQAHVPLLVLTADRPPELRHSGANQTVDQLKLYGDQVLWSVDMALPTGEAPAVAIHNVQTMACRAYATAQGQMQSATKGPVHLNFPFRKPLEPATIEEYQAIAPLSRPQTQISFGVIQPTPDQILDLAQHITREERGMIICGPRCADEYFAKTVVRLAQKIGYPILADPLSGLRFSAHVDDRPIIGGYDGILSQVDPPDLIIRFGTLPTSKAINDYINRSLAENPSATYVQVSQNGVWADDGHRLTDFIHADPTLLCLHLPQAIQQRKASIWQKNFIEAESAYWATVEQHLANNFFDGTAVAMIAKNAPPHANLFISNSLPIRHMDQFVRPNAKPLKIFASRGASGIDGITSTALGIAASHSEEPLILVIGDVALYHDLNGLLAIEQHKLENVTIVLLNNNGGNIFRRLPVAKFDPPFEKLFLTPHVLDFEAAARLYGLHYVKTDARDTFQAALDQSIQDKKAWLIEVPTDGQRDDGLRTINNI